MKKLKRVLIVGSNGEIGSFVFKNLSQFGFDVFGTTKNDNSENNYSPNERLNVLFIVADDLNCAIGAYGDKQAITPNIDKLASEGVLFENAHVQYPLCGPSRISLMTGLYPDQTKSKDLRLFLRQTIPDVITIGQRFIMEKYNSVRVGKIYHYHNPRDIGTSGHDDHFTWDQTVNPYGRDKIEEYKLNKVKENFDGSNTQLVRV